MRSRVRPISDGQHTVALTLVSRLQESQPRNRPYRSGLAGSKSGSLPLKSTAYPGVQDLVNFHQRRPSGNRVRPSSPALSFRQHASGQRSSLRLGTIVRVLAIPLRIAHPQESVQLRIGFVGCSFRRLQASSPDPFGLIRKSFCHLHGVPRSLNESTRLNRSMLGVAPPRCGIRAST